MSSPSVARAVPGRVPGGITVSSTLAVLCVIFGLTVYGALTISGGVDDLLGHAPGAAQPFDVPAPGDDVHKVFGVADRIVLSGESPATTKSLLGLVVFAVAASGGFHQRLLRGPPARN